MDYSFTEGGILQIGENIRMYQTYLNDIRVTFHGNWPPLAITGAYDRQTRDVVRAFQIFTNLQPTGVLNNNTQMLIKSKMNSAQRSLLFWKPSIPLIVSDRKHTRPGGHSHRSQAPEGELQPPTPQPEATVTEGTVQPGEPLVSTLQTPYTCTIYQNVTPPYETTAPPELMVSYDPAYDGNSFDKFKNKYLDIIVTIFDDINSIVEEFAKLIKDDRIKEGIRILGEKIKGLFDKFARIGEIIKEDFKRLFNVDTTKIRKIFEAIKSKGSRLIEKIKVDPAKIEKIQGVGKKVAKKAGIVAWAYQGLSLIYHLIMWATATDAEEEYYKKQVMEDFDGVVGSLISVVLTKLAQIGAAAAAGAIAGTAVPGIGNIVGAIVGVVVAIADIIVACITDKGLGDWCWEGLKCIGSFAAELGSAIVEKVATAGKTGLTIMKYGVEYWQNVFS